MKINLGPYTDNDDDRKIDVNIDDYDVWSMDHTLALIIVPMLKRLKEIQHGHPNNLTEEEWDEILDEMIWTFEQKTIHTDSLDACIDKCANYGSDLCKACLDETQERMNNGFKLFGQYFENLWD